MSLPQIASADIFEWEWVDPADHPQGKRQSTTLAYSGEGLLAEPGLDAQDKDLTQAYLRDANLTNANFRDSILANADLSGANLTDVYFYGVTLTNADFTNAKVRGARFGSTTDFTAMQLYSTASYQAGDLTGVNLRSNDLTGWNFGGQNLTDASYTFSTLINADFSGSNLTGVGFYRAVLTNVDFSGANLADVDFEDATLANADFTNAEVRGACFVATSDFTAAQLYSTASYQSGDLTDIKLHENDLTGWNFSGKNLTDASFEFATLTNTDFSDANLTNASFGAATLTNTDFSGANLTGIGLSRATLTNVDFTNAEIRGVHFGYISGFTATQLYSTASYQAGDLTGVGFRSKDLTGWNFSGQKLTDAFFFYATLTNTNLSRADARAAVGMNLTSTAITHNFIHPDGHVEGLDITASEVMRLWDYDSDTSLPILVEDAMSVDSAGTLRIVFEDEGWGSALTFEAGISVGLDGILELLVEPDEETDLASLVGTTFDLFDWAGVSPNGTFSQIITSEGLVWDTSELYTTGAVTLVSVPEPSTVLLLAMSGVAGLLARRKSNAVCE